VQIRRTGIVVIALAALSAITAGLSIGQLWDVIEHFVVALVFGALGLFMAEKSRLKGSLIVASDKAVPLIRDIVVYGLLSGAVLGLVNYYFFFDYRYSPYVLPRIRNIASVYDSFILSLEIALTEEVIYRLFFLSCILYTVRFLYARWSSLRTISVTSTSIALTASSLIFAFAHESPYSFVAALLGGIVLGLLFLWKGVEVAIAAHFAANFLFFSASYVGN
jgi:membrane protease YdiL (CAAX protease family)